MTEAKKIPLARLALLGGLAVLSTAGAAGCRKDGDRSGVAAHGERFSADGEVRPIDRFVRVQSAAAARTGATLNVYHFDAQGDLNSLGRRKLDLMLHDDAALPLVVHLDLARPGVDAIPEHGCRESVRVYLADRGVDESQLEFRSGPNAGDFHPARDGLRGLNALHADQQEAAGGGGAPANRGAGAADMMSKTAGK